jgi:hypothetical protein
MLRKLFISGILFAFSNYLYANSISSWWQQKTWRPLAIIEGGATTTSHVGESQNFPIQNPTTDIYYNYSAAHPTQSSGLYGIFLGIEQSITSPWLLQAGFDYNNNGSFLAKGLLTQGADVPSQDVYTYQYRIRSQQLWAEGRLLYTFKTRYHPYFLVGFGTSFNKAYNYSTNVPPFLAFTRTYQNNSETSFSYEIGVGIDVDINPHWRAGLSYRFADLGKVALGNATISTTNVSGTLSQSSLYVNQMIGQLTFVI